MDNKGLTKGDYNIVSDEQLMETDDVARYLNVHRKTVINLVERGELRGYRVGRNWRFRKSDVDAYLEQQREPKPDDKHYDD